MGSKGMLDLDDYFMLMQRETRNREGEPMFLADGDYAATVNVTLSLPSSSLAPTSSSSSSSSYEENHFDLVQNASSSSSSSSTNSVFFLHTAQVQIPLYSIIFLLAIVGNALVILTLVQNQRMRTVTNVHLLNLAISDLLLGVFCMPVTLVGTLLKNFVFGGVMCKLIPYLQAVCVAVSAWTLVAISIERHYAICHPFKARQWQTLSHAHRVIAIIWIGSLLCMAPIAILSVLQPFGNSGHSKCREEWPSDISEKAYNIFLDVVLLIIPLLIMAINYSLIAATLWKGIKTDEMSKSYDDARENSIGQGETPHQCNYNGSAITKSNSSSEETLTGGSAKSRGATCDGSAPAKSSVVRGGSALQVVRRSNVAMSLANKKRVIKMLFVVVLEYFVCWTPLYIIHTIAHFDPKLVYHDSGYVAISFSHLIAYASSCCNPITYCFMNSKFKHAFLSAFGCQRRSWLSVGITITNSSKSETFYLSSNK